MQSSDAPLHPSSVDLIEELPAAVLLTDAEGRVLQMNRAGAALLGRAPASVVGQSLASFIYPDDVQGSEQPRLLQPDGSWRAVEEKRRALADGRILRVFQDVPTSTATREVLRETGERLQFVASALPALIAYVDNDARYVWVNEAYQHWVGVSPDDVRGRHVRDVLGAVAWENIRHHVERVLAGHEIAFETRMNYSHGPARDVRAAYAPHRDASGRVLGFMALVTDVSEMRIAERALQRSERTLAESQAAAHVGSWEATFTAGEQPEPDQLRWSDEAYRIFGYTPGSVDVTYQLFVSLVHPDDREPLRLVAKAGLERGERHEKEYRIVRLDGTTRVIHDWINVERGPTGKPTRLFGTYQDITERKLVEEESRRAREQLQLVVDSTPAFIAHCDLERRLVWTNKSNAARFGKTPEQLVGKPLQEVMGLDAYRVIEKSMGRALNGETFEVENEITYAALGTRSMHTISAPTLDATGAPDGCVAVITDNTHRRELERALRVSEERYRSLIGAITSVVWTTNAFGDFTEPQPAWEAYTGQPWSEHQGRGWTNAIHPEDRERIVEVTPGARQEGAFRRLSCRMWNAASGDYRFTESSAVAIRNADGSLREWIGTLVDVHEQERALHELKQADRRKDEFLAMLSHELRNPLAPILNAVEILKLVDQRDPTLASTYRGVIAQQVQHMKRLLDDLLDVSRVSQGKIDLRRELVELGSVLLQAVEVSRPLIAEKDQKLSMTATPAPILLDADPTRLVQVFANLLNNAAKYSDRGGHIQLETGVENGEALVRVRDDGIGMSPDLLERAFDLFVQETRSLDRAQGGLGIGLTMVRSLVKMHGGSVRAFSDGPGRGSELVVRLPRVHAAPLPDVASGPHLIRPAPRVLRVLVVDDNLAAARSLGDLLALLGHQVTIAHDGPSALALSVGAPPELVLVDIGLPGMDGYALAAALRQAGLDRVALIALTGYGRDEDFARSRAAGFDHHLVKPVDLAALQRITTEIKIGADRH